MNAIIDLKPARRPMRSAPSKRASGLSLNIKTTLPKLQRTKPMNQDNAVADMVTMTKSQIAVIDRMDPDLGFPFRDIASDCGLGVAEVRSIIHQFHRCGLTGYGPLFREDEPSVCGSGYWPESPVGSCRQRYCGARLGPRRIKCAMNLGSPPAQRVDEGGCRELSLDRP